MHGRDRRCDGARSNFNLCEQLPHKTNARLTLFVRRASNVPNAGRNAAGLPISGLAVVIPAKPRVTRPAFTPFGVDLLGLGEVVGRVAGILEQCLELVGDETLVIAG